MAQPRGSTPLRHRWTSLGSTPMALAKAAPREAADLVQPFEALGEVLRQHGGLECQVLFLVVDLFRDPVETGRIVMVGHLYPP